MSATELSHAHAHVLAMLLGRGDADFTAEVPIELSAPRVMIAGMQGWNEAEGPILKDLGSRHTPAADIAETSRPILDWIAAEGITHLAVHFDLDVLDPVHFSPLLFDRPDVPAGTFDGIERGRMQWEHLPAGAVSSLKRAPGRRATASAWCCASRCPRARRMARRTWSP